jgi:hypothetical protein
LQAMKLLSLWPFILFAYIFETAVFDTHAQQQRGSRNDVTADRT